MVVSGPDFLYVFEGPLTSGNVGWRRMVVGWFWAVASDGVGWIGRTLISYMFLRGRLHRETSDGVGWIYHLIRAWLAEL